MSVTLAVIPTFVRREQDADLLLRCLVSLSATAPEADILVVDDGSPAAALVDQLEAVMPELGARMIRKPVNEGFSTTVNVGLREALRTRRDAVLVNADMEFPFEGWLEAMLEREDTEGRPAAVVGARLLYPNGTLQHAGIYFSFLFRAFEHRFKHGPADLPEALVPFRCPVTAALQLIRWETLSTIGVYDEGFRLGYEDVDYCLRVFDAGLECVYEPAAVALHHESAFRNTDKSDTIKAWEDESLLRLMTIHRTVDLGQFVPAVG